MTTLSSLHLVGFKKKTQQLHVAFTSLITKLKNFLLGKNKMGRHTYLRKYSDAEPDPIRPKNPQMLVRDTKMDTSE